MANGIDSIYDPSDVSRMLAELREQRLELERTKAKKTKGATQVGASAWKMWSKEQDVATKELLSLKSPDNKLLYEMSPEYLESPWYKRIITDKSDRLVPTTEGAEYFKITPEADVRGVSTISEGFKRGVSDLSGKVGETAAGVGETSEKAFGSTLGKVAAGVGAAVSAYDLARNWEQKSGVDKALGTVTTALSAASIFNPALSIFALGTAALDQFWD